VGGGRAFPLYAPFVLPNAPTAAILRSQPAIGDTLSRFGKVTKAVVEIGAWDATTTVYEVLTEQERATYRASGACADVAGHVFDTDGHEITTEFTARLITMSAAELGGIADLIGVSGGGHSAEAIHAVLKSGLLTGVVTDATTARHLLWRDGWVDRPLQEAPRVAEIDT
jgi:DNA-binding transcriptional regulator LsrR (DeoR family)